MNSRITLLLIVLVATSSCHTARVPIRNRFDENGFPQRIVWAWERSEDLYFLDTSEFGVAFLAQTLVLKGDDVVYKPRRQRLKVSPQMRLIAVTRIESQKTTGVRASLNETQKAEVVKLVLETLELTNVSAVQIDFDVATSEREFYRALLNDLRRKLPDRVPLSMTALASFCVGDRWLKDLPVDEAVPMIFRMGADDRTIKSFLARGNDFHEPLCRQSYGTAVDEPVDTKFDRPRRHYVFNVRAWTEEDVLTLD
ncbi:MAG TPA: hypothetical protein VFM63_15630 [Pyrinomonadaceae bacterium]|nr:hypothetical protein [Pyrinomonadaceae bacterium]